MAFGFKRGGDLLPLLKWDGRTGRFSAQDRTFGQSTMHDITDEFQATINLRNLQHGWLLFPKGGAPEMRLFPADQANIGPQPDERDWRIGLRVEMRLPGEDVWRETLSTALGLWNGIDEVHTEYLEQMGDHPDMLPVIEIEDIKAITGRGGVSYEPVFRIVEWTEGSMRPARPPAPKPKPKPKPKAAAAADMDDSIPF